MRILIGKSSCGIAAGALKIEDYLKEKLKENNLSVDIVTTGCIGMCYLEPLVDIIEDSGNRTTYVKVTNDVVDSIISDLKNNQIADSLKYSLSEEDKQFLQKQTRIAIRNCGNINPENINEYIEVKGYKATKKVLAQMSPDDIINEMKTSGLAGRGGAGFPTWFKWQAAKESTGKVKYVICNADEGDPGAFMDRAILEGDPHSVIEGMLIAGYTIGASEGIFYVRAEYPLAIKRLEIAMNQAREAGYLGKNILNSGFDFDMRIKAGAGAFVCGEETALIASLEGERGMPRLKPPFPAQKGYWQKPSNINNVETYANISFIINNGGKEFAKLGTENSKGTKVFALTGKVKKGGLVEIPMGLSIRDVVYGIAGGIKDNKEFKAVQVGGPSGGCIPLKLIDTLIDYRTLSATGAIMGSGGMVVMDETACMVDMARYFLDFTCKESCGKCIHCRIGTKRMLEILTRITNGEGKEGDIELLEYLAKEIKDASLCGLGQSAPNPVLTTIKYYRNEYEDHIKHKKCTTKQCKPLLTYSINAEKCTGCTLCARNCPTKAISGSVKNVHVIAKDLCIKCGKCLSSCRFGAVEVE